MNGAEMKAICQSRYGDPLEVLRLEDLEPRTLGDDDVLIRVRAAGVNARDWHTVTGLPYLVRVAGGGLRAPKEKVPGRDVSGVVEKTGRSVTRFQVGDEVFGWADGTFAELAVTREDLLIAKPSRISHEHAAAVPLAASTALQAVRDHGNVQEGQRVAIAGASGGVGTFAVQMAASLGAHVTAVCRKRNEAMVRSLGAKDVVDYTTQDFTHRGERYDLILEIAGARSFGSYRAALAPRGMAISISGDGGRFLGPLPRIAKGLLRSAMTKQSYGFFVSDEKQRDLQELAQMLDAGGLTPVVDRTYSLDQAPEAVRYLLEGHTMGKVVVTI